MKILDHLEKTLNYHFNDPRLAHRAMTHRSHANENKNRGGDNERLEFVGDAVLGLIVGHALWEKFPDMAEGDLSKRRAAIVSEPGLAKVARRLGLGEHIRLGQGERDQGGADKDSILSDALEALWAAFFLDAGFDAATKLAMQVFSQELESAKTNTIRDPKTELQEHMQSLGKGAPTYAIVAEDGPDHARHFTAAVLVEGEELARATGSSKKAAQQSAANAAIESLREEN